METAMIETVKEMRWSEASERTSLSLSQEAVVLNGPEEVCGAASSCAAINRHVPQPLSRTEVGATPGPGPGVQVFPQC